MVFRNSTWTPISLDGGKPHLMHFGNEDSESGMKPIAKPLEKRFRFWSSLKYLAPYDQVLLLQ